MRLNDPLVTSFSYNDKEYAIDLSFDNVLDVFDVLEDKALRDYEKAEISLVLLLGESFDSEQATDLWNYVYEEFIYIENEQPVEYDRKGNPMPVQKNEQKKSIDFDQDYEHIFASFQQAYNINLYREQGRLHWFEFRGLLNGLPEDTIMQRIRQIRLWEPSKEDPSEHIQNMKELQKIHALEGEEVDE
jgi:hypothetical protein